jgi:hypothetical protein
MSLDHVKAELKRQLAQAEADGDEEAATAARKKLVKVERERVDAINRVHAASERSAEVAKEQTPIARGPRRRSQTAEPEPREE